MLKGLIIVALPGLFVYLFFLKKEKKIHIATFAPILKGVIIVTLPGLFSYLFLIVSYDIIRFLGVTIVTGCY